MRGKKKRRCAVVVSLRLHAAEGAKEGGKGEENSPWSFNGKTSRPKEVGSS